MVGEVEARLWEQLAKGKKFGDSVPRGVPAGAVGFMQSPVIQTSRVRPNEAMRIDEIHLDKLEALEQRIVEEQFVLY